MHIRARQRLSCIAPLSTDAQTGMPAYRNESMASASQLFPTFPHEGHTVGRTATTETPFSPTRTPRRPDGPRLAGSPRSNHPRRSVQNDDLPSTPTAQLLIETFFAALNGAAQRLDHSHFYRIYDRLVHGQFLIQTPVSALDKKQWAAYWGVMVYTGVRSHSLTFVRQQGDDVTYKVCLAIGNHDLHVEQMALLRDGQLYRVYEVSMPKMFAS